MAKYQIFFFLLILIKYAYNSYDIDIILLLVDVDFEYLLDFVRRDSPGEDLQYDRSCEELHRCHPRRGSISMSRGSYKKKIVQQLSENVFSSFSYKIGWLVVGVNNK